MVNSSSTSSSMTSTSHTLTTFPTSNEIPFSTRNPTIMAAPMASLLRALEPANRHTFIAPSSSLPEASLGVVKETLDSFAGTLGDEQAQRLKEQRKKRKRGEAGMDDGEVLKIRKIYTEGFEVEQVWEQARRVIDALRGDAERVLEDLGELEESDQGAGNADEGVDLLKFDEDGFEMGSDDESIDDGEGHEEVGSEVEDLDAGDFGGDDEEASEGLEAEEGFEDEEEDSEGGGVPAGLYVEDPHKLNDGFFSIDEFNKQTEFLEQQDAAADPYTGEASDEEEIDWDADPSALAPKPTSSSKRAAAMDIEDEEEEESGEEENDGPTFGNMDLNAPEGDSDDGEEDDEDDMDQDPIGDNTNNVLYKDFFEPPPRKVGKAVMQANYLERQVRKAQAPGPVDDEAGLQRAMADVRRDLFEESENEMSEDALSDVDAADPKSRRSAHERRQAKLADEIRRLEAASVAKREWTLAGEARAADRPLNSLLDEDLEFERTGKPVLEVTAEVSESIEELIKRRILAQEFDEVIRRRPETEITTARRGLFELDDSKPQQSLAQLYEEEHVKERNPDTYVSKSEEKIRQEENEIEGLWKDVSAKLDALSSWHYKPKPAAPSLTVVSDVAAISMEDAQPTTAMGISAGQSMLAPQEIYKAGKDKKTIGEGEVVPKTGAPVARQEMTREEKLRRRRREKERIKKRGGEELGQRKESRKSVQKRETLASLKKGGVKVIGKKGEVRDVDGNKVQDAAALNGAGGFKL
ncbi:U3 small nucleolar ribonucleoprotein Mpp10 [Drepanopeziza brunnea f. sp. 'multigermtubi' MB_m1]|uniref:U3 small nucleolar ribonucleoprotein protein MPP10 n=1 Tax=Marssonina brunnea f. sp. multigermtubi (strain MB_m1) TaxID=1072389 RepID=K1XV29_MARBU|nr:U3 small nucleolar ribonucleoprotein Mpp10 [Drepanopeziza brunnea f. sp. 'multigermtubi' MB_m1]EKD16554.1 U3 small nucleolar ribonucleoprotein Mpp10 [Drepanopeziza brunnea f. sp. 'multigermtubi' MB_m1]